MVKTHVASLAAENTDVANFLIIHFDRITQEQFRQGENVFVKLNASGFPSVVLLDSKGNPAERLEHGQLTPENIDAALERLIKR